MDESLYLVFVTCYEIMLRAFLVFKTFVSHT